jgi:hypothetical protein
MKKLAYPQENNKLEARAELVPYFLGECSLLLIMERIDFWIITIAERNGII